MGSLFSYTINNGFNLYYHPDFTPSPLEEPTYDSQLGFGRERKKREMIATEAEMKSAKMPLEDRDYCAHLLLKFFDCRKENWPFVVYCKHEKHEYLNCKYEDWILRMKEYEREKRLRKKHGGPGAYSVSRNSDKDECGAGEVAKREENEEDVCDEPTEENEKKQ